MDQTETFTYDSYRLSTDKQNVEFTYTLSHQGESFNFTEKLRLPVPCADSYEVEQILRSLHLALGISYYKLFLPGQIIHPYKMDEEEANFWNDVWKNGLGEFLYVNKLPADRLAKFTPQDGKQTEAPTNSNWKEAALLGIGGGKDSIVAGELLKSGNVDVEGFVLATGSNPGQAKAVAETMGVSLSIIERTLDPLLLELNKRTDALNGHVPISLIFALVGSLLAASSGSKYVVVANEASASIPRVFIGDTGVNHQWSKSLEFERLFQNHLSHNVSDELKYFSAVRPLNSVALSKLFSQHPEYLNVFTSDNSVFRIASSAGPVQRWSDDSPKSLSSFILLAPWVEENKLVETFGKNFLDDSSLESLFFSLVGVEGDQPLDCVGTVDELKASLNSCFKQNLFTDSVLMKKAVEKGIVGEAMPNTDNLLALEDENAMPESLSSVLLPIMEKELKK